MPVNKKFNRNFGKWFLTSVIRAVKKYDLIQDNDHVAVALSGGKDSTTLLYILYCLQHYSYFNLKISAIHVRLDEYDTTVLQDLCHQLQVQYYEKDLFFTNDRNVNNDCYLCSRLRRSAIADLVSIHEIDKVAYGHNADDVAETFLMNMIEHRIQGSFAPRVHFRKKPMILIRPMIYLDASTIGSIHSYAGLPLLERPCSGKDKNIRMNYRKLIRKVNDELGIRDFSLRLVRALENPDENNPWGTILK